MSEPTVEVAAPSALTAPPTGLVKYEQTEVELHAAAKELRGLKIAGVDDATGYRRVHEGRMKLVRYRTSIEKQRVEIKGPHLEFCRQTDAEAKRLTAIVEPVEKELAIEQARIDAERGRIRAEAEKARREKLDSRVAALTALGLTPSVSALAELPDDEFDALLATARAEHEARLAREREEAARLAAEKAARDAQEAEARRVEQERLARERAEIEAERERQAAERKRLDDERAKALEELAAAQRQREAEQARLDAERREFEAQRAQAAGPKPVAIPEDPIAVLAEAHGAGVLACRVDDGDDVPTDAELCWSPDEQAAIDAAEAHYAIRESERRIPEIESNLEDRFSGEIECEQLTGFVLGYLAGIRAERARTAEPRAALRELLAEIETWDVSLSRDLPTHEAEANRDAVIARARRAEGSQP